MSQGPNAVASGSSSSSSSGSSISSNSKPPARLSSSSGSSRPSLRSRSYLSSSSSSSNNARRASYPGSSSSSSSTENSGWKGKGREEEVHDDEAAEIYHGEPRRRRMQARRIPQEGTLDARWKSFEKRNEGRARLEARQEGPGGQEGIVVPLQMIGSGLYEVSYVLPVTVGKEDQPQTFLLQVDSGSSDLWIASTSCNADSCRGSGSRFYNPGGSGALDTGVAFDIDYLRGHVEGPVYWDRVNVGGYSIENQALAAANIVRDEPLSESFHGLIGLALPLNSVISQRLPAVTTNDPDGAAWASNLFSITPVSNAPLARFIGMTLARPGSDRVPSLMAIGRHPVNHPSGVLKEGDVERIQYSTLVSERLGTLFWKTSLRELVVWVNGEPFPIELPRAGTGSVFPTAILDSGVPLIFTTSTIANAIYGAIGVSPSADGQYFVPCETPLNVTVRLDDRASVALHPLDLTADPPDDNRAKFCVGLIQAADGALGGRESLADVVLGVPFLRNVYSVMAYTQPNPDGTFPDLNSPSPSSPPSSPPSEDEENEDGAGPFDPSSAGPTNQIAPRLGLLGITDPTIAMDEFTTVRVLNKPISNNPPGGGGGSNADSTAAGRNKNQGGLSTGIIVAIVLVSFFGVCAALWVLRWFLHRRRDKMLFFAASAAGAAGAAKKKRDDDAWGDGEGDKEREMVLGSLYGAARTKGSLGGLGTDGYALGAVKSKRSSGGSTSNEEGDEKKGLGGGGGGTGGVNSASTLVSAGERERTVSDASTVGGGAPTAAAAVAVGGAAAVGQRRHSPDGDSSYRSHRPRMDSATLPPSSPEQSATAQLLDEDERERNRSPERSLPLASGPHHRQTSSTNAPLLLNDWQQARGDDSRPIPSSSPAPPLLVSSSPPTSSNLISPPPPALTPLTPQTTASIVSPIIGSSRDRQNPNKGILRPREPKASPASPPAPRATSSGSIGNSEDLWGAPSPPPIQPIKRLAALEDHRQKQQRRKSRGRSRSGSGGKSGLSHMVVLEEPEEGEAGRVPPLPSVGR